MYFSTNLTSSSSSLMLIEFTVFITCKPSYSLFSSSIISSFFIGAKSAIEVSLL